MAVFPNAGVVMACLLAMALLNGCASSHKRLQSSLIGEWSSAHGALGEFNTLRLGANGTFAWQYRDEPLGVEDTYVGDWRLQNETVQLLFTGGRSKEGRMVRPPRTGITLSLGGTGSDRFLAHESGLRLERAPGHNAAR